jgi:hypothetical protein
MTIRTNGRVFKAETKDVLLEFLGVKRAVTWAQTVRIDVELVALVPFRLAESDATEGFGAIPDGIA